VEPKWTKLHYLFNLSGHSSGSSPRVSEAPGAYVSFSQLHITAQQAIKLGESDVSLDKEKKRR
jgi:hypothetical protein